MIKADKGFTIVELLVAMTFFSFLLLLVTYGFVQINRTYTRGITTKTIQNTARTTIEDIARTLRFSDIVTEPQNYVPPLVSGENGWRMTVGDYCYIWNQQDPSEVNSLNRSGAVYADTSETIVLARGDATTYCNTSASALTVDESDTEKLLDERAAVQYLNVENLGNNTFMIEVVISTKEAMDKDLERFGQTAVCKVQIGDQYCDVAKYETSVHTRN